MDAARADYHHAIRRLCAEGGSMREIGDALGLSHQRVHQIVEEETRPLWRRRGRLFAGAQGGMQRFSPNSRSVLGKAQEEARSLGHDHVRVEDIVLGLLAAPGVARTILRGEDLDPDAVREQAGRGPGAPEGLLPFASETKKLLERALRESLKLRHSHIGTEHLLLALLETDVFRKLGVDVDRIRAEVHRRLAA